jgi:hypothetical protein|tara:strand:- start:148 stop:771 length:624 start_codon:yes stop_codon:yes gene_type:complete
VNKKDSNKEKDGRSHPSTNKEAQLVENQMPLSKILDEAVNRVKSTAEKLPLLWEDTDGSVVAEDIVDLAFPEDIEEFMTLMRRVEDTISAGRKIKEQMQIELGKRYEGKVVREGRDVIVGRPSTTYKPYDKEKVLDYLGDDWRMVVRPEFRVTGIKAVAKERGQDPDVIVESLFQRVITNNNISILPESKAPKWMKELEQGEERSLG